MMNVCMNPIQMAEGMNTYDHNKFFQLYQRIFCHDYFPRPESMS